jgi:hypothetical protein
VFGANSIKFLLNSSSSLKYPNFKIGGQIFVGSGKTDICMLNRRDVFAHRRGYELRPNGLTSELPSGFLQFVTFVTVNLSIFAH